MLVVGCLYIIYIEKSSRYVFRFGMKKELLKMFLAPATSFSVPPNYTFFIYI